VKFVEIIDPVSANPATDETRAVCCGLHCSLVLFLAGLFEFNFGDSEVLMVFLFLVSAPYALSSLGGDHLLATPEAHHPGGPSLIARGGTGAKRTGPAPVKPV
jgi:hypothetical protein